DNCHHQGTRSLHRRPETNNPFPAVEYSVSRGQTRGKWCCQKVLQQKGAQSHHHTIGKGIGSPLAKGIMRIRTQIQSEAQPLYRSKADTYGKALEQTFSPPMRMLSLTPFVRHGSTP